MFKERKTTQMAVYFLQKADQKRMPHLKLMKLLYLADRESIRKYDFAMTGDAYFSLPHGPILSRTKDLMDGDYRRDSEWPRLIADKQNHEVAVIDSAENHYLDELSEADVELLEIIWKKFGRMDQWQIKDYTHRCCSEWKDPGNSHIPITIQEIGMAVGKNNSGLAALAENQAVEKSLSSL